MLLAFFIILFAFSRILSKTSSCKYLWFSFLHMDDILSQNNPNLFCPKTLLAFIKDLLHLQHELSLLLFLLVPICFAEDAVVKCYPGYIQCRTKFWTLVQPHMPIFWFYVLHYLEIIKEMCYHKKQVWAHLLKIGRLSIAKVVYVVARLCGVYFPEV